jgi:AraC-like DNA-binding protein
MVLTPELEAFISRSQVLALRLRDVTPGIFAQEIRLLIASWSPSARRAEQVIVVDVVERMLAHFIRSTGLESSSDLTARFLDLALVRHQYSRWQDECNSSLDLCVARIACATGAPVADARVHRMMELIDHGFADASLQLHSVATAVDLSYWHAARLLKQQTGSGFVTHVRERRVAAARQLLIESVLSMKEIAARVGYSHASQFTREFRLVCGLAPRVFRQRHAFASRSAQ